MKQDNLKKEISTLTGFVMVIGTMVGSGVFFKPTAIFGSAGTAALGLIAWVIGGLLALAGGLTIAEIGTLIPETGGMMTYMEKIYGRVWGYLIAWAQTIVFYPVRFAAQAIICATQAVVLLQMDENLIIPVAVGLIIFVNVVNALGNSVTDIFQNLATFLKFMPIVMIIFAGFFLNPDPVKIQLFPVIDPERNFVQALSGAVLAALYATDGWMNVTNLAGEMKNPGKQLPKVIVGGISMVTLVYIIINIAYLRVLPPEALAASATPAADVANILFPAFGGKLITVGILISVFGSLMGFVRAGWRVPYALALRNLIPCSSYFAKISKKSSMPVHAGFFMMILTIIMLVSIGDFNSLTDIGSVVIWFFYILTFIGIFILRKKWPDRERPYKVPLYPLVPIWGIVGGVSVLVSTLIYQPVITAIAVIFTAAGIPVYVYVVKHYHLNDENNVTIQ